MTKTYIEELTVGEQKVVFRANSTLQEQVLDDMIESEMHWITEKLDYVRDYLNNWSVGTGSRSFISVSDHIDFYRGLVAMEQEVPAFTDDKHKEIVVPLGEAYEAYVNEDCDSDEFEELEEAFEKLAQEAADELAEQFDRDLDAQYDDATQELYFTEFYIDARMDRGTFYIKEGGDHTLYEHVNYEKSFN